MADYKGVSSCIRPVYTIREWNERDNEIKKIFQDTQKWRETLLLRTARISCQLIGKTISIDKNTTMTIQSVYIPLLTNHYGTEIHVRDKSSSKSSNDDENGKWYKLGVNVYIPDHNKNNDDKDPFHSWQIVSGSKILFDQHQTLNLYANYMSWKRDYYKKARSELRATMPGVFTLETDENLNRFIDTMEPRLVLTQE
jgi:hypothetical protein